MARIKKTTEKHHRLNIITDYDEGEVILVRGGKHGLRAYIWAGRKDRNECLTISGRTMLLRLAEAIKKELA